MARDLPPLGSLRAFEAAARHMSFKDAASELHVTPAAVSQQIKTLEDFCGIKLFRRLTRALVLTEAGQVALPQITLGLDQLAAGYRLIKGHGGIGPLVLSLPPSFATKWLVPRLGRFQERHPEIVVRIDATSRLVQFDAEGVDIGIRFGKGHYPGLTSHHLFPSRVIPVCSPDLPRSDRPLEKPADLSAFTLLHLRDSDAPGTEPVWDMWLRAAGVTGVDTRLGPQFSDYAMAIDAAVSGQGVGLVDATLAEAELKSGRLIQPFADVAEIEGEFCYYLVYPQGRGDDPRIKAFKAWIESEILPDPDAEPV